MRVRTAVRYVASFMFLLAFADWQYHRGFDAGVGTTLCVLTVAQGDSASSSCIRLSERQRNYAVRVGRGIADKDSAR